MIFVAQATYRRHLKHSGDGLGLNWPVSRSTSRHFPNLVAFDPELGEVGGEVWPYKPSKESPGAGAALRVSLLARGFDSTAFRPIWGIWGSVRDHFPISGVSPLGPHGFPYYIPIPPAWLCCVDIFVRSCRKPSAQVSELMVHTQTHGFCLVGPSAGSPFLPAQRRTDLACLPASDVNVDRSHARE